MKILYITSKPPFPVLDGGCYATGQFLKLLLHAGYKVDHFAIGTQKHPFDKNAYPDQINEEARVFGSKINTELSVSEAFIHLFKKGSYNINRFHDEKVEDILQEYLNNNNPDVIIFDSLYSTPYLDFVLSISDAKLILRSHNVECDIWRDMAKNTNNKLKKSYFKKLASDLEKYELTTLKKLDAILCISTNDQNRFNELGVSCPLYYIPVNLPVADIDVDYSCEELLHIGSINWEPNKESINRLISWLPAVKQSHPNLKLNLIGNGFDGSYEALDPEMINEEGFVEDLEKRVSKGGILVTLIDSGSGVRIKILEMMAMGIPVVSNTKGLTGIESNDVVITDTETEFVNEMNDLLNSREKRESLGRNAKNYIRKHHNIDKIAQELNGILGKA